MVRVDKRQLEEIDRLETGEYAARLREEFLSSKPRVSSDRARLAMESWRITEGEAIDLRRAKLLKRVLEGVPLAIFHGQLLVGGETNYLRGANPHCDFDGSYLASLLEEEKGQVTLGGPGEKGALSQDDYATLVEAVKFWKGKTGVDKSREETRALMGDWYEDLVEAGNQPYEAYPPALSVNDWERIINEGLGSFIKEAEERIAQWRQSRGDDIAKLHFWQAAIISLEAAIGLAHRYSSLASEMAASEPDPKWRNELEEIAKVCRRVPENPARTFREALQSIVLVWSALKLETAFVSASGAGLVDQYLYPYFKRDLEEGRLTLQDAADLVSDLLLFLNRLEVVMHISWRDYFQKGLLSSIGLGGLDRSGQDATNELTYLILHMAGRLKYVEPHLVIRWHKDIPQWVMRKALETNWRVGGGVPQFQNGEQIIRYLVQRGVSIESARYFMTSGCSQPEPADAPSTHQPSYINVPLCLDLALHDGVASKTGKRIGIATGDPRNFKTFGDLYDAFKRQLDYVTRRQLWHDRLVDRIRPNFWRRPLASALFPGCLEKGQDYQIGGCRHYKIWYKKDRGIVPAADSLTAIKHLVYNEKKVSMGELLEALDSNFAGERGEEIRHMCLAAPKYGNDNDEADRMVRDVGKLSASIIVSEKSVFGLPYAINRNGQAWHLSAGKKLGALPNGRKSGEVLTDGSLSATQGADRNGITALLNSALKADFNEDSIQAILNVKFPATLLQTAEIRDKVVGLTQSFLERGGSYIQYNVVDAKALAEARRNPEKYRDLVVRVGGYSAYFVNLSPQLQDEIIRRTEQSLIV